MSRTGCGQERGKDASSGRLPCRWERRQFDQAERPHHPHVLKLLKTQKPKLQGAADHGDFKGKSIEIVNAKREIPQKKNHDLPSQDITRNPAEAINMAAVAVQPTIRR